MDEIGKAKEKALELVKNVKSQKDLDKAYLEVFGKKSLFASLTGKISQIPKDQRAQFGKNINAAKAEIEQLFENRKKILGTQSEIEIDPIAPGKAEKIGHLHLVSQAIEEIVGIFSKLGFTPKSYPEADWEWYAFEGLNMPKNHPARDEWETFFVKSHQDPKMGRIVLTPHTSNGQVREMEEIKIPPIRMLNISRCYRRQIDISHTPMFHQFEGLLVDEKVTIGQLKGTLDYFTQNFFGKGRITRLRPHHFRFTEPSFEVDITCAVCMGKGCRLCKAGWLELGGAGMVHPNVLASGNIDPEKYSGFAFGWGIERVVAMKTDVDDIRLFYQNDMRFLEQF